VQSPPLEHRCSRRRRVSHTPSETDHPDPRLPKVSAQGCRPGQIVVA
jgi:hypothetical protein